MARAEAVEILVVFEMMEHYISVVLCHKIRESTAVKYRALRIANRR